MVKIGSKAYTLVTRGQTMQTSEQTRQTLVTREQTRVRGNALKWFTSYLTGRTQKVKYAGIFSTTTLKVTSGVPQGSKLGPLFF